MPYHSPAARLPATLALLTLALTGCEADGALAPAGAPLQLEASGLRPLDPAREGRYALWAVDRSGVAHPAGSFTLAEGERLDLDNPIAHPVAFEVTVEPPGDSDAAPSPEKLLTGAWTGGRAELTIQGAVTRGDLALRERPGQFTMYFSPSDNFRAGFPSHEEAGIWLFNVAPRQTDRETSWVYLTQLRDAWIYEGWVVRDHGSPGAIWLSYGKFRPDSDGALRSRDNTGWGPFSGVLDYRTAGEEDYPGDDWISNPLGYPWPADLPLPLNLKETGPDGRARWTHLISIEPARDLAEGVMQERPFLLRPYRDSFQAQVPGLSRAYGLPHPITLRADELPRLTVRVR